LGDDVQDHSPLPEISSLRISTLLSSADNALTNALRRVIAETTEERVNFAAHGSSPVPRE
jgi:hypothetical protein